MQLTDAITRDPRFPFDLVADELPTVLYAYDARTTEVLEVFGNPRHSLGCSASDLLERQPNFLLSLAHPSELPAHLKHFAQVRKARSVSHWSRTFRLKNSQGEWAKVCCNETVSRARGESGARIMLGSLQSLQRERPKRDIVQSGALLGKLVETTNVIPYEFDSASGRFTYIGPQAAVFLGDRVGEKCSLEEWLALVHPDDLEAGARFAAGAVFRVGGESQVDFRMASRDGVFLWMRQIVHCVVDDDGCERVRGFLFDVTESKKAEEEKDNARLQLRELAARNLRAREEERKSVAREIHDELGQALTLFTMDLAWLSSALSKLPAAAELRPLQDRVETMEKRVSTTFQAVRRVLSALRPPLIDELGLADTIDWYAGDFSRRTALRCERHIEPVESIGGEEALAIFRIFQEITTNIARHAEATRFKVMLRVRGSALVLLVSDNGKGVSLEDLSRNGHFGILGIRERAWAFGGQVWVEGVPGEGTTVRVELPVSSGSATIHE